jgi:hypothetical protein
MIEAKGPGYADKLDNAIVGRSIRVEWIGQATRQVQASQGRRIEWYFAEQEAADEARDIFDKNEDLRRIFVFTVPAEAP